MSTDDINQTLPHDLPVLTEVVSEDDLPTLTDVVETPDAEESSRATDPVAATEPQLLAGQMALGVPPQLESHLEALFMQRLLPRLEEAQRQAVAETWRELKDELPQLIRETLPPGA